MDLIQSTKAPRRRRDDLVEEEEVAALFESLGQLQSVPLPPGQVLNLYLRLIDVCITLLEACE